MFLKLERTVVELATRRISNKILRSNIRLKQKRLQPWTVFNRLLLKWNFIRSVRWILCYGVRQKLLK